jgi:hypothetical protein
MFLGLQGNHRSLAFILISFLITLILLLNLHSPAESRSSPTNSPSLKVLVEADNDEDDNDDGGIVPDLETAAIKAKGELQIRGRHTKEPTKQINNVNVAEVLSVATIQLGQKATSAVVKYRPALFHLTDLPLIEAYKKLVKEYLAPWRGLEDKNVSTVKVTQRMLATMEYSYKGGGFRVRICDNKIYFRKLVHWKQTYRTQRMLWYLKLLYEILKKDRLLSETTLKRGLDFVIYVGDGAKVASDTFTVEAGFPLFSLRTSMLHIDIPIPDPVQHGSNGQYKWTESGKSISWDNRRPQLVFRGRGSCLKMQADNWHFCNRVRLQQLAQQFPEEMDAGIIQWNQVYKAAKMVSPPGTIEEIERTTGLKALPPMDFDGQSHYKYIIDVDGGLGSSRKPGILSSGSLLYSAESPWYTYYEPMLEPYKHYIPVDRWLRGLPEQVRWAKENDAEAKQIMENGRQFESKFLSIAASKQYMAVLLEEYGKLLADVVPGDTPVEVDYCSAMGNKEIELGPMGCSQSWALFNGHDVSEEFLSDKKL